MLLWPRILVSTHIVRLVGRRVWVECSHRPAFFLEGGHTLNLLHAIKLRSSFSQKSSNHLEICSIIIVIKSTWRRAGRPIGVSWPLFPTRTYCTAPGSTSFWDYFINIVKIIKIVCGLPSTFQVCIVHFLVFWGPGKFWLKRVLGVTPPPPPQGDIVTFLYRFL